MLDIETDTHVIMKMPSIDLQGDTAYLERFLMEEWIARRINNSAHVLKPCPQKRQHKFLYIIMEYIDGQTLTQWMRDNPNPDLETVRGIDGTLKKALHPNPYMRYSEISEFLFDLRHPNKVFHNETRPLLLERDPVVFWKGVSFILSMIIIVILLQ